MFLRASLIFLATACAAAPAAAQSNTFDIQVGARVIGHDTYTLAKTKQGYKLTSRATCHGTGVETDLSNDFKLSENYVYLEGGSTSGTTQMHTSFVPNKTRTDLVIGMVQAGVQESHHLSSKPDFAVLPNFDVGAAQAFLLLALTHHSEKNLYNIVVPTAAGPAAPLSDSGESAGPRQAPSNNAYDALFSKGPDSSGTLDGKPIALHTYILASGKNTWTFYADDANTLMQLDNSWVRANYIRTKFRLDPPATAP